MRASRSRYSAGIGSRSRRNSIGDFPFGLPRKYSCIAPGLAIGLKVGFVTACETRPAITWYFRPSISAHCTQRLPSRGSRWRVNASSAS